MFWTVFLLLNLEAAISTSVPQEMILGREIHGQLGSSLACGYDFNGDGSLDCALGAPSITEPGRVIFSTEGATTGEIFGVIDDELGNHLSVGNFNADIFPDLLVVAKFSAFGVLGPVTIGNISNVSNFTIHLEGRITFSDVGDVNHDGHTDVILGCSFLDDRGAVYVFLGPLFGTYNENSTNVVKILGGSSAMNLGTSGIIGDFNGDTFNDILIAAHNSGNGRVFIVFGPLKNDLVLSTSNASWTGESTDSFGIDMAIGDLNNDTHLDVIIAAARSINRGGVYVFYGPTWPIAANTPASNADAIFYGTVQSRFGRALAVGDIDADGDDDLLVGAPSTSSDPCVYALHGPLDSTFAYPFTITANERFGEAGQSNSFFGASIEVADFSNNGLGLNDVIIGAPGYTGNYSSEGAVFRYYGTPCTYANFSCLSGCDNMPYSTKKLDFCGQCGGENATCFMQPPSDVSCFGGIVSEDLSIGTVLCELSVVDADVGDTFTYQLNEGGSCNVTLNGKQVVLRGLLDYEGATSCSVNVTVFDNHVQPNALTSLIYLNITDVNEAPTSLLLSPSIPMVAESTTIGTTIAIFDVSPADASVGDSHTFSRNPLRTPGVECNVSVAGNELKVAGPFNFARSGGECLINISVVDSALNSLSEVFVINITDMDFPPTDVVVTWTLSGVPFTVRDDTPAGTQIATLAAVDPDAGEFHTFSLLSYDNKFSIVGTSIQTDTNFNFADEINEPVFAVTIRATDTAGFSTSVTVNIESFPLNLPPTEILINGQDNATFHAIVPETLSAGSHIGLIATIDPNSYDAHNATVLAPAGFLVSNGTLVTATLLTVGEYNVRLKSEEANLGPLVGPPFSIIRDFAISVYVPNSPPANILLNGHPNSYTVASVSKNLGKVEAIGDANAGDTSACAVIKPTEYFQISNGNLTTTAPSTCVPYVVAIRCTDDNTSGDPTGPKSLTRNFTIHTQSTECGIGINNNTEKVAFGNREESAMTEVSAVAMLTVTVVLAVFAGALLLFICASCVSYPGYLKKQRTVSPKDKKEDAWDDSNFETFQNPALGGDSMDISCNSGTLCAIPEAAMAFAGPPSMPTDIGSFAQLSNLKEYERALSEQSITSVEMQKMSEMELSGLDSSMNRSNVPLMSEDPRDRGVGMDNPGGPVPCSSDLTLIDANE